MRLPRSIGCFVLCLAMVFSLACSTGSPPAASAAPAKAPAATPAASATRGLDPGDMDPSTPACGDFYRYADGGWLKKNPVPADHPSWGAFNQLDERNREILHQTLEKLAAGPPPPAGSEERKIADFYASCMDSTLAERDGAKPLAASFRMIAAVHDRGSLQAAIADLDNIGVKTGFNFRSTQDAKNSARVIAEAYQGGLGLPDRDYYTKTDSASRAYWPRPGQATSPACSGFRAMTRPPPRAAPRPCSRSRARWPAPP